MSTRPFRAAPLFVLALLAPLWLGAVETDRWDIEGFKEFSKGKAMGVEIDSSGGVRSVWSIGGVEVPADGIWNMASRGGVVYLGTGNSGKLFKVTGKSVKELADTGKVAITKIVADSGGRLWFSAIPGGTIYRMAPGGELEKFAETGEEYVWDFILDGGGVLAATGPNGKILRISSSGKVTALVETGEKHVMCLAKAKSGKIYAGTSGEGLVIEVLAGDYRVIHDFKQNEVRRVAVIEKDGEISLVAAVNDAAGSRPPNRRSSGPWARGKDGDDKSGDDDKEDDGPEPSVVITRDAPSRGGGKISGDVYAISKNGSARRLVELDKRAAADMAVAGDNIFVATDQGGKVYRSRADSADFAISFDLKEAQALSLLAEGDNLAYIGTGSPANLVSVKRASSPKAVYESEVFDAEFPARWGAIEWQASGLVRIETRSGNIKDPERGWSEWRSIGMGNPGDIKSPPARYLQVRVEWPLGSKAELKSLSVPFRVVNQPHYVNAVKIDDQDQDDDKKSSRVRSRKSKGNDNDPGEHETKRKIAWDVDNPDDDPLVFELFFQPENNEAWIPIKTPEPISKTKHEWDTSSVPDGWYRLKVVAKDSPANSPEEVETAEGISDRFLVDNRGPEIKRLRVWSGKVSGTVVDSLSAVSGIQFQVDGGEWITVPSADGVLDTPRERFSFDLPGDVEEGPHIIAVRAWDRAMNLAVAKGQFEK